MDVADHRHSNEDVLVAVPEIVGILIIGVIVVRRGIEIAVEAAVDEGPIDRVVAIVVVEEEEEAVEAEELAEAADRTLISFHITGVVGATVLLVLQTLTMVVVATVEDNLSHRMYDDPNHVPMNATIVNMMVHRIIAPAIGTVTPIATTIENVEIVLAVEEVVVTRAISLETKEEAVARMEATATEAGVMVVGEEEEVVATIAPTLLRGGATIIMGTTNLGSHHQKGNVVAPGIEIEIASSRRCRTNNTGGK